MRRTLASLALACALCACTPERPLSPIPTDYVCTNDGRVSFMVEDIKSAARPSSGGPYVLIETQGMQYDYTPRAGDVCTTIEGGL